MKYHIAAGKDFETLTPHEFQDYMEHVPRKLVDSYIREKVRGVTPIFISQTLTATVAGDQYYALGSPRPGFYWTLLVAYGYPVGVAGLGSYERYYGIAPNDGTSGITQMLQAATTSAATFSKGQILLRDSDALVTMMVWTQVGQTSQASALALEIPAERVGELYV